MKKLLLILFFALLHTNAHAIVTINANRLISPSPDSLKLQVNSLFEFKMGPGWPALASYSTDITNDTVTLNVFYDTRGVLYATFSGKSDTVSIYKPADSIHILRLKAYQIGYIDTTYEKDAFINLGTFFPLNTIPLTSDAGFSLYPTAVSDILHIQCTGDITDIIIYNLAGRPVYRVIYPGAELDLSELSAGCYLLQAKTQHTILTRQFTKY